MKKWLLFGIGLITGMIISAVIAACLFFFVYAANKSIGKVTETTNEITAQSDNGVTLFDEPGEIFDDTSFQVFSGDRQQCCFSSWAIYLRSGHIFWPYLFTYQ